MTHSGEREFLNRLDFYKRLCKELKSATVTSFPKLGLAKGGLMVLVRGLVWFSVLRLMSRSNLYSTNAHITDSTFQIACMACLFWGAFCMLCAKE